MPNGKLSMRIYSRVDNTIPSYNYGYLSVYRKSGGIKFSKKNINIDNRYSVKKNKENTILYTNIDSIVATDIVEGENIYYYKYPKSSEIENISGEEGESLEYIEDLYFYYFKDDSYFLVKKDLKINRVKPYRVFLDSHMNNGSSLFSDNKTYRIQKDLNGLTITYKGVNLFFKNEYQGIESKLLGDKIILNSVNSEDLSVVSSSLEKTTEIKDSSFSYAGEEDFLNSKSDLPLNGIFISSKTIMKIPLDIEYDSYKVYYKNERFYYSLFNLGRIVHSTSIENSILIEEVFLERDTIKYLYIPRESLVYGISYIGADRKNKTDFIDDNSIITNEFPISIPSSIINNRIKQFNTKKYKTNSTTFEAKITDRLENEIDGKILEDVIYCKNKNEINITINNQRNKEFL